MSLNLAGTQYGMSQNGTRNNANIKFLVDQEAFSVNLHLCIASNAIPMLFIYHFYDWGDSFCHCASSNNLCIISRHCFNASCIYNCILLWGSICMLFMLCPYLFSLQHHNKNCFVKSQIKINLQREMFDAQKLLSGKRIHRVPGESSCSNFWSASGS